MQDPYPDKSIRALSVLESMFQWLVAEAERRRASGGAAVAPESPAARRQQSAAQPRSPQRPAVAERDADALSPVTPPEELPAPKVGFRLHF